MNRIIFTLLITLMILTQIGCWDVQDVADTVFVTAMGLDSSKHPDKIQVTVVMPKPSAIKSRSDQDITLKETVEAESISRAIEKLETRLARRIRLGHLRYIVIGEELSSRDIKGYTDFFGKVPEVALRTKVSFVQGGEAREIFEVPPIINRSVTAELVGLSMISKEHSLGRSVTLQDLRKELLKSSGTMLASRLVVSARDGQKFIENDGGTVLKDWRVIGWLDENEVKGISWFLGRSVPIVAGKMEGGQFTFSIDRKFIKIKPDGRGGQLGLVTEVKASGNILEERFGVDLSEPKNIKKMEKLLSRLVKNQVTGAIEKSQKEFGADYLGFGRALEIQNPELFRKLDWSAVYPTLPITVKIKADVHRFGKTK